LTPDRQCVYVFAPNWLGDAVMALPAIADLRGHFADAEFVVAARPSVAGMFELVPGIDRVVTLRWRGRAPWTRAFHGDLHTLRGQGDPAQGIAVLLPNSFAVAWVANRAGISQRWGYATDWRAPLLTRSIPVPRGSVHQGRYYQALTAALGMSMGPLEPRINVPAGTVARVRSLLEQAGWDGQQAFVAIAPGAAYGTAKRWLPTYFAQLIAALARDRGLQTVLVGGPGDVATVRTILGEDSARAARPIDVVSRTSLHELAGVIALASACVSNDSGAMHLAGAIGTPIVALFGPTRETETAPLVRADGRRDVLTHPVWCRPCMLRECPIDHRCMKGISPQRVLEAVGRGLPA
jgi:heptosyltransferase-2